MKRTRRPLPPVRFPLPRSASHVPTASRILLLARDPIVGALLGMFVELAGHTPVFPDPDEQPVDAIARMRPLFVVLLDGTLDAAQSDLFFAQAARRRVALAILGPPGQPAAIPEPARRRGVPYVETPTDLSRFVEVIRQAHESRWWQATSDRRRAPLRDPVTERDADGTLVYVDRDGARWHVYDRRGVDRRRDRRLFVNDQGETFSFPLNGEDAGAPSAPELERQLALATRV